jgi:pseudaminic acid synthase
VREAARCGADAIKLQTLTPSGITLDSPKPHFCVSGTGLWDGRRLHDLYGEIYTPWEWHVPLKELANSLGMDMFTSPFSVAAVDFLEDEVGVDVYKVASFESGDVQLLRRIARTGKPVILSTGLATLAVLEEAVNVLRANGATEICLLKCTSAYPADPRGTNLAAIPELSRLFGVVAGLSDHTLGPVVPITAVALGARIVEKHFILDRAAGGPDSTFSLEPAELKDTIDQIRIAEQAMGVATFGPGSDKELTNVHFRRSLFVGVGVFFFFFFFFFSSFSV